MCFILVINMKNKKIKSIIVTTIFLILMITSIGSIQGAMIHQEPTLKATLYYDLAVYFIDVGQGDSILIRTPEYNYILIDTGSRKYADTVINFLENLGVTTIHTFVATHPHEDHIGGAKEIFQAFDIQNVYHPGYYLSSTTYRDFLTAAENEGCPIYTDNEVDPGDYMDISYYTTCQILNIDQNASNANEASIVMRLDYNQISFLFTGDIDDTVEAKIVSNYNVDIDILKVAHHGSAYGSSDYFLYEATPSISVISVGRDNKYGHPSEETIDRLRNIGSEIYRTDQNGNIEIETDGINWKVHYEKSINKPFTPEITGPTAGEANKNYTYTATTIDPENDPIYYTWNWGDGKEETIGPYYSGEICYNYHRWESEGRYKIKVKATDEYGYESEWAILHVSMPREKTFTNNILKNIIDKIQQKIPFLKQLFFIFN